MLVVEYRHGLAVVPEYLDDLLEELVPRVFRLPFFIPRIIAVFAYEHHSIDGKLAAAERQCLGDGRTHFQRRMPRGALFAEIVVADLVDIERHQIHGWMMVRAVPAVAVQKTI